LVTSKLLSADVLDDKNMLRMESSEFVASRYQQLRQEAELLAGSGLALFLLTAGASLHAWNIEGWRRFLISVAVCSFVVSIGSIALSVRRHLLASRLAKSFDV
jgi:hypothetical protein